MAPDSAIRRLAAIFAVDVVGYSRLMREDETGTLAALMALRAEAVDPAIAEHRGRIVKTTGDGLLAEFQSVVDAVTCAVAVQREMAERNGALPEARRMVLRIGVNLGDVIVKDGDLYGDGVNVAARLEGLAEPGGICVSGMVYEEVRHKLPLGFHDLGPQQVKNIPEPVAAYRVALDAADTTSPVPVRKSPWRWLALAAGVVVLAATAALWWWRPWVPRVEPASLARLAFPLPDKPSIAVLPFDNLSGDPEQVYFADGITEDLITDLSKISSLFVIARASTFVYRGRPVTVKQVAEELGVSHVLEGSVRRAGSRVRVTAQLIDAGTGTHIWAERYDRELKDVFALQDEVVQKIVSALAIRLTSDEEVRLSRSEETTPEAYDTLLRGLERLRRFTPTTIVQGRELFEKAIAIDPRYARAYANVAFAYAIGVFSGIETDPEGDLEAALRFAEQALALDPEVPQVHFSLSLVYWQQLRISESLTAAYRALEVEPNYADGFAQLAAVLVYAGRSREGLQAIRKAMRLNPRHPFFYIAISGRALFALGDYAAAAAAYEQALERNPDFVVARRELAASYAQLGRIEDAEWEAEEILALQPDFSLSSERRRAIFQKGEDTERYIDGLRKAGLPE